jgi:hypothetical protein
LFPHQVEGVATLSKKTLSAAVGALLTMAWIVSAHAQVTVYDDFTSAKLDPRKWFGREVQEGNGGLEALRLIHPLHKVLVLANTVIGSLNTSVGHQRSRNQVHFKQNDFRALQFDMLLTGAEAVGCPAPLNNPSIARVGFTSVLFNDGSSTGVGDSTGNVGVVLYVGTMSDFAPLLVAVADIFRCNDPRCDNVTTVASSILDAPVPYWTWLRARMRWDMANKTVEVQFGDHPPQYLTYTQPEASLRHTRLLETWGEAANCGRDAAGHVSVKAYFNNVLID